MMNKNILIVLAVIVVIGITGAFFVMNSQKTSVPEVTNTLEKPGMLKQEAPGGEVTTGEEVAVTIQNFAFSPKTVTIKAGTTVTWTNKDAAGHSATADDQSFDTGILAQGANGTVTFTKPGTYAYHCTPHPYMKATIVVE